MMNLNLNPKPCKRNSRVLCGVVKKPEHCPYVSENRCNDNTVINLFGTISDANGTITLQPMRYDIHKISFKVLQSSMCEECKVIWESGVEECPICNLEE